MNTPKEQWLFDVYVRVKGEKALLEKLHVAMKIGGLTAENAAEIVVMLEYLFKDTDLSLYRQALVNKIERELYA